jgi:hypothetical protein
MFEASNTWQYIRLPFTITGGDYIEWRMVGFQSGITDLFLDHVMIYQEASLNQVFARTAFSVYVNQGELGMQLNTSGALTVTSSVSATVFSANQSTPADALFRGELTSGYGIKITRTGTTRFSVFDDGNVYVGNLGTGTVYSAAGNLTNTNPSDLRLKNTINPLTYGLNEILQLNPKTFYYNDDVTKSRLKYGFIAQDVKEVMPELARKLDKTSDYLGLETEGIFVTLVNAVKELKAELDLIKNK